MAVARKSSSCFRRLEWVPLWSGTGKKPKPNSLGRCILTFWRGGKVTYITNSSMQWRTWKAWTSQSLGVFFNYRVRGRY